MRRVEFRRILNENNALRVKFELDRGKVTQFAVQLECRFYDKFIPIVRYDTAHNFAHCDRLHPYEPDKKDRLIIQDYNEALTFAIQDLTENWEKYQRRYERWMEEKR